jgi:hypothetical protein
VTSTLFAISANRSNNTAKFNYRSAFPDNMFVLSIKKHEIKKREYGTASDQPRNPPFYREQLLQRKFCKRNSEDEGNSESSMEELEKACWDGLLYEMLPELVGNSMQRGKSYIGIQQVA